MKRFFISLSLVLVSAVNARNKLSHFHALFLTHLFINNWLHHNIHGSRF